MVPMALKLPNIAAGAKISDMVWWLLATSIRFY